MASLCSIALTATTVVTSATAAAPTRATIPSSTLSASLLDKPSVPLSFEATPADQAVDLAWQPPSRAGASPITGYQILQRVSGGEWAIVVANTGSTTTTRRITGLTNGTEYFFRIAAVNSVGVGMQTGIEDATPRGLPAAPTPPIVESRVTYFVVTWQRPDANGAAIRGYHLEQELDGSGEWTTVDPDTSLQRKTVEELTPGGTYRFRVRARNAAGVGPTSLPSSAVRAPTAPDAPSGIVVERGIRTADSTMHWLPPAFDGGSTITRYVIERGRRGGWEYVTETEGTTTANVGWLDPAVTYRFRVAAANQVGMSPWTEYTLPADPTTQPSTPSPRPSSDDGELPYVASPEPMGVTVRRNTVRIAWGELTIAAPAPNREEDRRPFNVRVEYRVAGTAAWHSAGLFWYSDRVATVSGLTKGATYEFRLVGVGSSRSTQPRPSPPSQPFRFVTAPGRASSVDTKRLGGKVRVTWVAPRDTGGSAVTHYRVQTKKGKQGWTKVRDVPADTTRTSLRPTAGRGVKVRVAAINAQGIGPFKAAAKARRSASQ